MKKWLKIWLIVWWSLLVAWWARAGLTKTWIIPNWFEIEALCPNNDYLVWVAGKPIIYFYPTTKTEINVKLWTPYISKI